MEPLINKYAYILYKDETEDIKSELNISLWEAVNKIRVLENDGQVFNYFSIAIKNRFLELYRNSKKIHDHETTITDNMLTNNVIFLQKEYDDLIIDEDIAHFLEQYNGMKKNIFYLILFRNYSDVEIAKQLGLSRQYINRIRQQLQILIQQYFE